MFTPPVPASGSFYLDRCYCPGKDPYLARDANLRKKMYHLKSVYTSMHLPIQYRPGTKLNYSNDFCIEEVFFRE